MKVHVLKLRDGDHTVFTPSGQFFIDLEEIHSIGMADLLDSKRVRTQKEIRNMMHCLLRDSEPDKFSNADAEAVGRLLDLSDQSHYVEILGNLITDAMPKGGNRPNTVRGGQQKAGAAGT